MLPAPTYKGSKHTQCSHTNKYSSIQQLKKFVSPKMHALQACIWKDHLLVGALPYNVLSPLLEVNSIRVGLGLPLSVVVYAEAGIEPGSE